WIYSGAMRSISRSVVGWSMSLPRYLREMVPISRTKDIATAILCAAMAGLCRLVIDLVLIVVGEFFPCCDIPNRHNPDGVAKLFRVAVWVTRMVDITCCVLGGTPINGVPLIQAKDIDIAYG